MEDGDEAICPLCTEPLDATERTCSLCQCGYSMCLWCWHQLMENAAKENLPGRCPNCRATYDREKITQQAIAPSQLEEVAKETQRKKPERKPSLPTVKQRRDLASVRVVQRNLVYAVGLSMDICHEDILRSSEYFGQFGKPVKVSVNRTMPTGLAHSKNGASGSAYVTYRRPQEAQRCVETVDGITWAGALAEYLCGTPRVLDPHFCPRDKSTSRVNKKQLRLTSESPGTMAGRVVRACFGTTKYCNAFLKGIACNNGDCLYLHAVADDADSFTKEAMLADASNPAFSKFAAITQLPAKGRGAAGPPAHHATATSSVHQPIAAPAPLGPGSLQRAVTMPASSGRSVAAISVGSNAGGGGDSPTASAGSSAGGGTSWAAVFAAPGTPALTPPPRPPGESSSDQEWPSLAGGSGGSGATAAPAATESPRTAAAPARPAGTPLQPATEGALEPRNGATMAAQLARAYSAPVKPAVGRAAAGKKAAQVAGAAGRGRGTKTLVPPPPPLSSAPKEDGGQVPLSAASVRDAKATAGMQLKRSPSQKAAASEALAAAAAASSQPAGTVLPDRRAEPQSPAHRSADAPPSHAEPGPAANGIRAQPRAAGGPQLLAQPASAVRQRSAGPPPGFGTGPPPGFDRPLNGASATTTGSQAGGQPPLQNGSEGSQSPQLVLPSAAAAVHGASNGLTAPVAAEARNGSGRTQSRFSFARSPPVAGDMVGSMLQPAAVQSGALLATRSGAPDGSSTQPADAWLRQLQQGANGAPPAEHVGAAGHPPAPASVGLHNAAHVGAAPSANGHGVVTGFRPGSRGPPPGFAGWVPQQPPQQSWGAPLPANGSSSPNSAHGNGSQPSAPASLNGDAEPESSPAARGRRRRGKAGLQQPAPAAATQLPLAPPYAIASLHDTDTLAGRLQQAREKFYSLRS